MGGLLKRLSILAIVILFISFFVVNAQTAPLPFIHVASISPSMIEVFDIVTVTVSVLPKPNVAVVLIWWSFGDSNRTETYPLNATTHVEYSVNHLYGSPGTYYLSVGLRDAANQTAGDVQAVTVQRQTTSLALDAVVHGQSGIGYFTLQANLLNGHGLALNGSSVDFWYSSDGVNWLQITTAKTDINGTAQTVFTPTPEEGNYQFRARYLGDSLRQPSQFVYIIERNQTVLAFTVTPSKVNQTATELFFLQACLATSKDDKPLPDMQVIFYYYTNRTQEWMPITDARTGSGGCTIALFEPLYEGVYEFKVTYAGDLMFASNESYFMNATAMPEFPFPAIVPLMFTLLLVLVVQKRRTICASS